MKNTEESVYWNVTWDKRISETGVSGNQAKFSKIMNFIWQRPQYFKLMKLEVGCGPGQHATEVAKYCKEYIKDWMGIDLSHIAISHARKQQLNAVCDNFLTWDTPLKFQCFSFWDSLEHFKDPIEVADKVCLLSDKEFMVQGNIPLYYTKIKGAGIERPTDINTLTLFWDRLGLRNRGYEVYGVNGYPYLLFEANNFGGAK